MKLYGVIGYPLAHSFSKKYFTQKFLEEGIADCSYEMFALKSIDELQELLKNPELCGLNITIPYKQLVLPFLTDKSKLPLNACNCIKIGNGKIIGYNTDVLGFEKSLLPLLMPQHNHALILGTGGAAEAVKFVLNKLNIAFTIVSRKTGLPGTLTYEEVDEKIIKENLLIINTTPLGTFPNENDCANIPYQYLTPDHYLFDLVYNPAKSLFLLKGEAQGAAIKNGYDMLVIQAEESWNIWTAKD